jgi:hypothetical protein
MTVQLLVEVVLIVVVIYVGSSFFQEKGIAHSVSVCVIY